MLKGLAVARYTDDEAFAIYRSIGNCLGNILVQNIAGDSLMSIQDYSHDQKCSSSASKGRIIRTNADISLHTDSVGITRGHTPDILALLALRTAKSGGASTLVSGLTVHNILLKDYPEYLERLYQPFYFARVEVTPEEVPLIFAPIFTYGANLNVRYSIIRLLAGYEKAGIKLTNFEREVLDAFEALMNREDLLLTLNLDEGDILLVNNRWILHAG